MKYIITTVIFILIGLLQNVTAQEVKVEISYDTIYAGNYLAVRYNVENWQGELKQPDFGEFRETGGPQISSSMSYSGGQRRSSRSVTYLLSPPDKHGTYTLPSQTFRGEGKEVSTEELIVVVKDNPGRIQQNPVITNDTPRSFNKQYRRQEPVRGQRQQF